MLLTCSIPVPSGAHHLLLQKWALKYKVVDEVAVPDEGRRAGMEGQAGLGEMCPVGRSLPITPASARHQLMALTSTLAGMDKPTETITRASHTFGADALKVNPSRDARHDV